MNLFHKFHFAKKRIKSNKKMSIFSVIIMTAAFVMLYSSFILFEGLDFGEKAVKNSLNVPVSSCGILQFEDGMDWNKLQSIIYSMDEIKAVGTYDCYGLSGLVSENGTDYWNRMLEIQNSGELEFTDEDSSNMQIVLMNCELFDMENIELIAGGKMQTDEQSRFLIYLGYNFREIPLGTTFKDDSNIYEVAGIMEKGTYITDPHLLTWNLGGLTMAYKVNLDNMMLVLQPEGMTLSVRNLFCVNDGYTYEDAASALQETGNKQGIKIKTGTFQARLNTVFSENKKFKGRIDTIAFFICISVFVICVTVQLLNIYMKRNELGIWLANGMNRKEILWILWLENFIKAVVGGTAAIVLENIILRLLISNNGSVFREIVSMMYGKPLLELIVAALLLVCIISVIPIIVIARRQTTELVKGVWN